MAVSFGAVCFVAMLAFIWFLKHKNSFIYRLMFTSNIKRVTPKPGRIKYDFNNGLECYQEELTLKQDDAIIRLIEDFDLDDIKEGNIKIKSLIQFLLKNNALVKALRIILNIPDDLSDEMILTLNNSELQVVFQDFFLLNPGAEQIRQTLLLASATTNMMKLKNMMDPKNNEKDGIEQKK